MGVRRTRISEEDRKGLGKVLTDAREKAGLTKTEMAKKLNTQYSDVHRWETTGKFTHETFLLYAKHTGIDIVVPA